MPLKHHDFIEVEYTGKTLDDNLVFDTTDELIAKENRIYSERAYYGPVIICLGEGHLIKGLDEKLIGKDVGEYEFELTPEEGFGKKEARLIQLIPTAKFRQQHIQPIPGLQVNIDGMVGTVKTVSGGRTIVDFNHPLSGKRLHYKIKVNRIVTDKKEQITAIIRMFLGIRNPKVELNDTTVTINLETKLPKQVEEALIKKIKELTGIEKIQFSSKKQQ